MSDVSAVCLFVSVYSVQSVQSKVCSLYSQKCAGHKEIDKQPIQTKKKKTTSSKMTEKRDTCVQPTTHTNKQTKKLVMFILYPRYESNVFKTGFGNKWLVTVSNLVSGS